jgi:hypothetical protein
VPAAFEPHVRKWLPSAEQVVIDSCGHVPQVERPEETNALLMRFFAQADIAARESLDTMPAADAGAAGDVRAA